MQKIILIFTLLLSNFIAFSQINPPCVLDAKDVYAHNDTVFIMTKCAASKTNAGWIDYTFATTTE